jgi:hypothetical protein
VVLRSLSLESSDAAANWRAYGYSALKKIGFIHTGSEIVYLSPGREYSELSRCHIAGWIWNVGPSGHEIT